MAKTRKKQLKTRATKNQQRRARRVSGRELRRIEAAGATTGLLIADPGAEPLALQAAATEEAGTSSLRKFSMDAYNGGPLKLGAWAKQGGIIVDLSGLEIGAKSRPILRDHAIEKVVGHTTGIENTGSSLRISGVISAANSHAAEIASSADNGFPWQASIGALPLSVEFIRAGQTVSVNGRVFRGPVFVARRAALKEVSFVALGADDTTSARMEAGHESEDDMDFEDWLRAKGFDPETLNDTARATLKASYDAENAAGNGDGNTGEPGSRQGGTGHGINASGSNGTGGTGDTGADDPLASYRASIADEADRVSQIRACVAEYGISNVTVDGNEVNLESHAIRAGWSRETTELHALRTSRGTGPAIGARRGGDLHASPMEAALLIKAGLTEKQVGEFFDEKTMNTAIEGRYAGATLHMLMDATLSAAGQHYSGSRKDEAFVEATFRADQMIRASGFSTLSLSGVLGNVANKLLLASYNAQAVTWPLIAAVRNNTDFKPHTRYRLDATGSFRKVGPDGELKHVGLAEAGYTAKIDTFGAMIVLTRHDQINDDLQAFAEIPTLLGRMSAVRVEEAIYTLLLANPGSFFSVNNGNLLSGAGSALDIDGYTAAEAAFRNAVDASGKPILVTPSVLLTGTTLSVTADQLAKDTKIELTGSTDKVAFASNPHAGKFSVATSPYINNTAIRDQDGKALSGQSGTQWYLFADPAQIAAVSVAFLNGKRVPTIQYAETDFNTLGMQWRGFHDFGVAMEDPKAAVKNVGA